MCISITLGLCKNANSYSQGSGWGLRLCILIIFQVMPMLPVFGAHLTLNSRLDACISPTDNVPLCYLQGGIVYLCKAVWRPEEAWPL